MTKEQLAKVTVGDTVRLQDRVGKVTRCTGGWFMVSWTDPYNAEIIPRRETILVARLELVELPK